MHAATLSSVWVWRWGTASTAAKTAVRAIQPPIVIRNLRGGCIAGLSLVQALTECGHLLERHGGHEMAAGLTLRESMALGTAGFTAALALFQMTRIPARSQAKAS